MFIFRMTRNKLPRISSNSDSDHCQEDAYKLLPEAIVILNPNNKIIYLNPEAENMLSCKLRRIMGREYSEVFTLLNNKTRRVLQGVLGEKAHASESLTRDCLLQTSMNQTFSIELTL